jgi:hypothetical protein
VDIQQRVLTFVTRKFEVDIDGVYSLETLLSGLSGLPDSFNTFYNQADHRAFYSISAAVSLELVVYDDNLYEMMPGFPVQLSLGNPSQTIEVALATQTDLFKAVGYQLRVTLAMEAEVDNFLGRDYSIQGVLDDHYQVGTSDAPIELRAVFTDPNGQDSDEDGVPDSLDNCPDEPNPDQADEDGDGVGDACDGCPQDPDKSDPGACGCGVPDTDSDTDGTPDCIDNCPNDPEKTEPGLCGCGVVDSDTDTDTDGVIDCLDAFPDDPDEWADFDGDGEGDNSDPDDDNDGMPDEWETTYGLDPYLADDADLDADSDGWTNLQEYRGETDPTDPDDFPAVKRMSMPWIPLLLLSDDDPVTEPTDCDELIADDCNLAAPEDLAFAIEEDDFGNTYVDFTWSSVECAPYYVIRVGTVENVKDLPPGDLTYAEVTASSNAFRADFSAAEAGTFYWTVTAGCSEIPVSRGAWSVEESFEFAF